MIVELLYYIIIVLYIICIMKNVSNYFNDNNNIESKNYLEQYIICKNNSHYNGYNCERELTNIINYFTLFQEL